MNNIDSEYKMPLVYDFEGEIKNYLEYGIWGIRRGVLEIITWVQILA